MFSQKTHSFSTLFIGLNPLTDIQTLVKNDSNVLHQQDVNDLTLLHVATQAGNLETVHWLLKQKGVDINARGAAGVTPLHLSVRKGNKPITELLLGKGAAQVADDAGRTPLHEVTYSQSLNIAKLLLKYKHDIDAVDKDKKSPVYYALQDGCLQLAELFLQHGISLTDEQEQSWLDLLKEFNTNATSKQLIYLAACSKGYLEVAKKLLEADPNLQHSEDTHGDNSFLYAAAGGQIFFAEWLLENNPAVKNEKNKFGETAFLVAAAYGQIEFAKWLLELNPAVKNEKDNFGYTAFLVAAANGQIEFAKWLLENNLANAKEKSIDGLTAFLLAAATGQIEFAKWLLENKLASPKEKSNDGRTAFLFAAANGQIEFAKWLLENKLASSKEKVRSGNTAFLLAAGWGKIDFASWLLTNGHASVLEQDECGRTAFSIAFDNKQYQFSEWLIKCRYIPYKDGSILSKIISSIEATVREIQNPDSYLTHARYEKAKPLNIKSITQMLPILKILIEEGYIETKLLSETKARDGVFSNIFYWLKNWGITIENTEILARDNRPILLSILRSAILLCLQRQELDLLEQSFIIPMQTQHRELKNFTIKIFEDYITDPTKNNDSLFALKAARLAMRLDPNKFIVIVRKLMHSVCDTIALSIQQVPIDLKQDAIKQAEGYWQQHFELYTQFDAADALRLNAEFACRLEKWDIAYENYLSILAISENNEIKQKASFEIAEILVQGNVSVSHPLFKEGLACQDIPKLDASDDEATHNEKLALKRQILMARAIPAYEYIAQYKNSPEAGLLLARLHCMLAGYEPLNVYDLSNPRNENFDWLPEAVNKFTLYYAAKLTSFGFEEYVAQLSRITASATSQKPAEPSKPAVEKNATLTIKEERPLAEATPVPQAPATQPVVNEREHEFQRLENSMSALTNSNSPSLFSPAPSAPPYEKDEEEIDLDLPSVPTEKPVVFPVAPVQVPSTRNASLGKVLVPS